MRPAAQQRGDTPRLAAFSMTTTTVTATTIVQSSPLSGGSARVSEAKLHSQMTSRFEAKAPRSESWLSRGRERLDLAKEKRGPKKLVVILQKRAEEEKKKQTTLFSLSTSSLPPLPPLFFTQFARAFHAKKARNGRVRVRPRGLARHPRR